VFALVAFGVMPLSQSLSMSRVSCGEESMATSFVSSSMVDVAEGVQIQHRLLQQDQQSFFC
jgi:hypothetical protein